MKSFGNCEVIVSDTKIVLKENKSSIVFKNRKKNKIRKVIIDDCVIKSGLRCDFLIIDHKNYEHFIELKGADVDHAVKQIENTINSVSQNVKLCTKFSYIISSRCPLLNSQIQNLKVIFKKKYNSKIEFKNIFHEINLDT